MNDAKAMISNLPPKAAKILAVDILLAEPESLADDVLESCLYLLRERLQGTEGGVAADPSGCQAAPPGIRTLAGDQRQR